MKLSATSKKIISGVVSIPTAPFHEHKVISYVAGFCLRHGLKLSQDKAGDLFIRYKRGKASQPVAFTAHMDHPGFEVLRVIRSGRPPWRLWSAEVGILGGIKLDYFKKARVIISTEGGLVRGRVSGRLRKKWMGKPVFKVEVKAEAEAEAEVKKGDFGYYDLPNIRFVRDKIYTKSADNLAGTALLLDLLLRLKRDRREADVTVVLTRAEEVGFAGCIYVADEGSLSKRVPIIVLETSNAKAGGVKINGGPVIRVGDKQSGFSPEIDSWLQMVAEETAKKVRSFKYQRALLSGGRCEASAYMLKGYCVGGMAFPLGNYHNNGRRSYAPEYIGADDYMNMLEFFYRLSQAPRLGTAFKKKKKELWDNYRKWKKKF